MARRYVVVEENAGLGCCNMVLWDFIIVALTAGSAAGSLFHIHTVFCILIGIFAGGVMIALMGMKKFGKVLQLLCSLFWTYIIWSFLATSFNWNEKLDVIWTWAIRIFIFLFATALHFASAQEIIGDTDDGGSTGRSGGSIEDEYDPSPVMSEEHDSLQKRYNALLNDYNESTQERNEVVGQANQLIYEGKGGSHFAELVQGNNTLWREGSAKMSVYMEMLTEKGTAAELGTLLGKAEALLRQLKSSTRAVEAELRRVLMSGEAGEAKADAERPKAAGIPADEDLFAGCDSKKSLQKRYKSLMKTFHPDNLEGDETMAVKISAIYEELLKKY